jgi:hypothetical protein
VKWYVDKPEAVAPDKVVPVFHRWIQQSVVPGFLIDVADYRHMIDGPGVMLVGHDVDYALDLSEGRPGMVHTRKRSFPDNLHDAVAGVLHAGLTACRCLVQEKQLGATIDFRTDEIRLVLQDRLHAPNESSSFDQLRDAITDLLRDVYEGADVAIARETADDRRCLTARITAPGAPDQSALIERLTAAVH